jgi:hypothetical protein
METCTVETGLLKKKPCAKPSVTHCGNCEQPLCKDHAVPELGPTRQKTGKFMCKECAVAAKEHDKAVAAVAARDPLKKPAPPAAPAAGAPKPAAAVAPAAPAAAPGKEEDSLGGIDFTPAKK